MRASVGSTIPILLLIFFLLLVVSALAPTPAHAGKAAKLGDLEPSTSLVMMTKR